MKTGHSARLDLNLLVVFDAVAEARSTTGAAARLSLTQSAVSHAVARLRDVTGDRLFVRSGGRLVPTPHAEAMMPQVREALLTARGALSPAGFDPATTTRRFRVGASDYALLTLLPGLVARLRAEAPGATLEGLPADERMLERLSGGALDFGFIGAEPPGPPYRSRTLLRERFVGLVCARHPMAGDVGRGGISLDAFLAYPHVQVTFRDPRLSPVDAALAALGRSRRVALTTPSFAANVALLSGTDLVMCLPSRLVASLSRPDLVTFELPLAVPDYPYTLLWHERTEGDAAASWLRGLVDHR